jgi:hypothetical protein
MQIERKRDAGALVWVRSLQLSTVLPADGAPWQDEQLTRQLPPSGQAAAPPSTVCGTGRVWTPLSISATTWSPYLNHGYLLPMFKVSRWVIDQSIFNAALPKARICWPFLFKGLIIGICSSFGANSATYKKYCRNEWMNDPKGESTSRVCLNGFQQALSPLFLFASLKWYLRCRRPWTLGHKQKRNAARSFRCGQWGTSQSSGVRESQWQDVSSILVAAQIKKLNGSIQIKKSYDRDYILIQSTLGSQRNNVG